MVVSGEEGFGASTRSFMNIFNNGLSDGEAVISACAPTKLVKEDEATGGEVVENIGSFVHFHHESGFSEGKVVGSTYTGEDFVDNTDAGGLCRNETAGLRQKSDECCLPE